MKRRRIQRLLAAAAGILLFLLACRVTGVSFARFWARRDHLGDVFLRMLSPDWPYFSRVLKPLWATVQMSVTGTALGAFLALLLAPLCTARTGAPRSVRAILRFLIQLLRSFPTLILALAATFLFGLGIFAGTVAILLYTFAIMTRLSYEDIETADLSAYKALRSMGCSGGRAYFRAVVPGIATGYLSNALYLLETNVRHSAILGYVGAGGIGLLLNEKISWKEYDRVAVILVALFLAVCLIELMSTWLISLVLGERRIPRRMLRLLLAALALLFVFCTVTLNPPDFSRTSLQTVANMLGGFLHPDWALITQTDQGGLAYLLLETLCIALAGTVFGALLSLPLSIFGSARLMPKPIAILFRVVVMAIRSIPFLIYAIIFIRVTGPGAFTGVLTMAICSVGLLSKRFSEAIDALDLRPFLALKAMGVSPVLRIRYAVLPQLMPALFSALLYRFDVNTREAAILGIVGAGGIGAPLVFAMNHYRWSTAGAISLGLILIVWLIDLLSGRIRRSKPD